MGLDPVGRASADDAGGGHIEGINSLLQAAKAKARGCLTLKKLLAITYLVAGKLDLRLPT